MIYNLKTDLKYDILIVSVVDARHFFEFFKTIVDILCRAFQVNTNVYPR